MCVPWCTLALSFSRTLGTRPVYRCSPERTWRCYTNCSIWPSRTMPRYALRLRISYNRCCRSFRKVAAC
uniref:Putative secreted peptide n=1 Tax=Anopheles braziliensis TaxID=58242 RepID=A0A2M3ZUI8_9DIPT